MRNLRAPRGTRFVFRLPQMTTRFVLIVAHQPELLPTWMSFEEKALAQGIQLMDLQRSATFEPPKLSPPPAAAQPAFSFSVLETDSDRPRPKPLTNAKKSPDKRHKNPPLSTPCAVGNLVDAPHARCLQKGRRG